MLPKITQESPRCQVNKCKKKKGPVQIYYLGELLVVDGGGWLGSGFANLLAWVQSSGGRGAGVEPKTDALMFF